MLGTNDKVVRLRNEHLNRVNAIAQVVLASIQSLLLDNLVAVHGRVLRVPLLFVVKGSASRRAFYLLPNDEVRLHQTVLGY